MTISINITLPPLESVPPAPAQSYLIAARHLYAGMEALSLEPGKTGIACAFLAAQSLECGLKSYLSHVGITEDKLKAQQIRHNLKALWAEAVQHGLNAQAQPPQWCVILNSAHDKPYYFRYPMGLNMVTVPALVPMAQELKNILAVVEKSI
ncbi:MAG: hypothetical protein COT35_00885 [Nitrospirae bacterium CG08_land_8_20_14_0_20_52_24]|nr:MAG: hypothetical protein COT35_00885 [Nitrospirae bacterium CG08_land_8_20_14_0_20_52_24]PIV83463.1 MAG: hypothetical protein COW52_08665 [Nitrospirae bacterium CG17_big_fil_post_rev_8_21_14_2_50_50_9]